MRRPKYKLSPNEVERLVKEERERLRKLRIVQVREQAKANAALIRNQVRSEKERLLADFTDEVKQEVLAEKEEKIRKLEQKYDSTLRSIGQGHTEVLLHGDGQNIAERVHKRLEDEEKAQERFKMAIDKHDRDKAEKEWEDTKNKRNRKLALEIESQRSAFIASLPPPPPDEISFDDKPSQKKAIPMTDMKSFAGTHYHIPDFQVVKAGPDEQLYDAKALAEQTDLRLKQDLKEKKRSHHEQVEKARIRGNEALQKEMLKHDLGDMLKDLSLLQRKDRRRRQALLAEVPNQVFIPPEKCLEEKAEKQLEMERQFEEMYTHKQPNSDPSTLQTWSELADGDDTTNESELSTLESVPLPPSEMALRDVTAVSKKADNSQKNLTARQPDTVLKQLLNKIKEQRMNVLANQKQGTSNALPNQKFGKKKDEEEEASVVSAQVVDSTMTGHEDEDLILKGHQFVGMEDDLKSGSSESKSTGSKILTQNNALIEELQGRIQKIEDQKLRLADQLQSQSDFYQELKKQQQELQSLKMPPRHQEHYSPTSNPSYEGNDNEPTLEDVSLPSPASQNNVSGLNESQPIKSHFRDVRVAPPTEPGPVDLSDVMSKLRPVAGIFSGTRNPQYELLTSNGFLPSPDNENIHEGNVFGKDLMSMGHDDRNEKQMGIGEGVFKDVEKSNILNLDNRGLVKEGGGARRMIDFGGRDFKKADESAGGLMGRSNENVANGGQLFQRTEVGFQSLADQNLSEDPMRKKISDYHSRAQELHASMDESTLNKVRDYQKHILHTHQERKQLLENIREDIERRRQALHTTSKFGVGGGAFLMNLGGVGSGGPMTSSSISSASSYPMLSSSIDSRPVLSGSQSERVLEPIKPFIADAWLGSDSKKPSILKPSSQFESQASSDLSKFGGGPDLKPPSSIDKIRKSLAFDDLNESNADGSPALYRTTDDMNDTTASKHSQALTDDSKLTSSEEDRGSPILHGNRSDRWDTSDKSTNSFTGSSSLNGSALVARAEERREGFERRQQELRDQLFDIQRQKESILQRYQKGQQAIHQQQQALRSKFLLADSCLSDKSQLQGSETHGYPGGTHSATGFESTAVPKSYAGDGKIWASSDLNQPDSLSLRLAKSQSSNGQSSTNMDRFSRRSSGSGGSLNLTEDAYLDEISYHQFKDSDNDDGRLQSAPQPGFTSWSFIGQRRLGPGVKEDERGTVLASSLQDRSRMDWKTGDGSHENETSGLSTWASVLSSNATTKPDAPYSFHSGNLSSPGDSSNGIFQYEDDESSSKEEDVPASSSGGFELTATPSSQPSVHGMYHHQPHELSTIIEVDTPTATSSLAGSSLRLASASQSVQSLASHASTHAYPYHNPLNLSDVRVDSFPDLPQVLPVATTGSSTTNPGGFVGHRSYSLATGGISTVDSEGEERGEGDGITLTEVSLGATSLHTLESISADIESGFDTTGGYSYNLSQ